MQWSVADAVRNELSNCYIRAAYARYLVVDGRRIMMMRRDPRGPLSYISDLITLEREAKNNGCPSWITQLCCCRLDTEYNNQKKGMAPHDNYSRPLTYYYSIDCL